MVTALQNHFNLLVYPRESAHQSVASHQAERAGRSMQDPAPPLSHRLHVITFEKTNSLPSSSLLLQVGGGSHYRLLKVSIDMVSQAFYLSASDFIRAEGPDALARIWNHRHEVHETISYSEDTMRTMTVIAE